MKLTVLVGAALLGLTTLTDAAVIEQRPQARADCRQQARNTGLAPMTQKWKNSIKDCMIRRGFNGR